MTLTDLLERVRQAKGADIDLNCEIFAAIDPWYNPNSETVDSVGAPHYTGSIDSAVGLVVRLLPGWAWEANSWGEHSTATLWECDREGWHAASMARIEVRDFTSPPLALCAALLTALIAQQEKA